MRTRAVGFFRDRGHATEAQAPSSHGQAAGVPAGLASLPGTVSVQFFILIKGDTPSDQNDDTLVVDFP